MTKLGVVCGWSWLVAGPALAAEAPPEEAPPVQPPVADLVELEPPKHTNPGFALGLAHLGVVGPTSATRLGLHLELKSEAPLAKAFTFGFVFAGGLTTPENTVAMLEWGYGAGETITGGFGPVTEWAFDGTGDGLGSLRSVGALFAYVGLGVSYLFVPVVWVLSPFASVGHVVLGSTVGWHTGRIAPDGVVELGFGSLMYGDPIAGGPEVGCGPLVGVGGHLGERSVSVRLLISPPGLHTGPDEVTDTVLSGALVVAL